MYVYEKRSKIEFLFEINFSKTTRNYTIVISLLILIKIFILLFILKK